MTVTITGTGANRTFTYTKTATSAKVLEIADKVAHFYFDQTNQDPSRLYSDLTNAEKIQILDRFITFTLMNTAKTFNVQESVKPSIAAAQAARILAEAADLDMDI